MAIAYVGLYVYAYDTVHWRRHYFDIWPILASL